MGIISGSSKIAPPPPLPPLPPPPPVVEARPEKTEAEIEAKARTQSLLRRSRGRFGTVLTGFRGFLNPVDGNDNRKTLLGE